MSTPVGDKGARTELSVVTKMYDYVLWLLPNSAQFSRAHRYTLGTRMENAALEALELLVEAGYAHYKRDLLQRANRRLESLRFLMRLAKDLKLISPGSYEFSARALVEIGSEVGGWIKQQRTSGRGGHNETLQGPL